MAGDAGCGRGSSIFGSSLSARTHHDEAAPRLSSASLEVALASVGLALLSTHALRAQAPSTSAAHDPLPHAPRRQWLTTPCALLKRAASCARRASRANSPSEPAATHAARADDVLYTASTNPPPGASAQSLPQRFEEPASSLSRYSPTAARLRALPPCCCGPLVRRQPLVCFPSLSPLLLCCAAALLL